MLGREHAWSGLVAGTTAGIILRMPPEATATLAALSGGWATWNDLDQCGSCAARSLGFASEALAWLIRLLSGGHRHLTHTVWGVAIFTTLAWVACQHDASILGRSVLAAFLLLGIAAGLGALKVGGHYADLIALAAAAGMAWFGWGLALVPLAVALGTATHIAGDMCTDSRVMLFWPLTKLKFGLPEPFAITTGSKPERRIVFPLLVVSLAVLGMWAIDPAADRSVWGLVLYYI